MNSSKKRSALVGSFECECVVATKSAGRSIIRRWAGVLHDVWFADGYKSIKRVSIQELPKDPKMIESVIRLLRRSGLSVIRVAVDPKTQKTTRGWYRRNGTRHLLLYWRKTDSQVLATRLDLF